MSVPRIDVINPRHSMGLEELLYIHTFKPMKMTPMYATIPVPSSVWELSLNDSMKSQTISNHFNQPAVTGHDIAMQSSEFNKQVDTSNTALPPNKTHLTSVRIPVVGCFF